MCSRCRVLSAAIVLLALAGCQREKRHFEAPPGTDFPPTQVTMSPLVTGVSATAFREQQTHIYEDNAYHLSEGKRLFSWFNCAGCHGHGGGNIGPALMDEEWIYGGDIDAIYLTIAQGRPNGMPAFAGRIPAQQIWQLAAYVRSLGGHGPKAARPSRDDHIQIPAEQGRRDEPVVPAPADPSQ